MASVPAEWRDMTTEEMRSLDRFVTARGAVLAGVTSDARRVRVMGILASVYGLLGAAEAGVGIAMAMSGKPLTALLIQGGTFLLTGGLMAGIRQSFKHRMQQDPTLPVEVAPEAKALLQRLLTHLYGWPLSRVRRRRRFRRLMQQQTLALPNEARCESSLQPETFTLLERAAREANRIYGVLGQVKGVASSPLDQMAPSITAAADEGMIALFQMAALIEKYPESRESTRGQAEKQIADLRALAEQVEKQHALSETASSTRLHAVLHALNADNRAREELNASITTMAPSEPQPEILINRSN